jgi:hypothetical protein
MFGAFRLRAVGALLVVVLSGCSITPRHDAIKPPPKPASGEVKALAPTGFPADRVGWGRFTLFSIPIVPIHVNGDGPTALMQYVHEALELSGYHVTDVRNDAPTNGPLLHVEVLRYRFNNYTWLFPIVPTWGRIELKASLVLSDGSSVWDHTFKAKGSTLNFTDGYTIAAAQCTTSIMQQMVNEFSREPFVTALTQSK